MLKSFWKHVEETDNESVSEEDNWGQRSEWNRLLSMALVSDQEGLGAGFASYLWPDMKQGAWSFWTLFPM